MTTLAVVEGATFSLDGLDRAFLLEHLGGFVEHRAAGIAVHRLVGHVSLPSGSILSIRSPKAPAASVLSWLAFTDRTLRHVAWGAEVGVFGELGDVAALTARLFLAELRRALAHHGMPRGYAAITSTSSLIRGRIDFAALVRRGGDIGRTPCKTWERRPTSPTVRTLAAAVERIASDAVMRCAAPADLRAASSAFVDVPALADRATLAGSHRIPRNEAGFEGAVTLARVLLRNQHLTDSGSLRGRGYLVNLESLFEATVVQALQDAGEPVTPKASLAYLRLGSSGPLAPGAMEMDAFCPGLGRHGVVVDAKYKRKISSSNLHQMVSYCHLTGARTGVLVMPSAHTGATRTFVFRGGRGGAEVFVHVVGLATTGTSLAAWQAASAATADAIRQIGAEAAQGVSTVVRDLATAAVAGGSPTAP